MVSLPICNIFLRAQKRNNKPYPNELKIYGYHLRKKRLDLKFVKSQVVKIIDATPIPLLTGN